MTDEERDIITRFIQRVSGATPQGGFQGAPPQLPPVDHEADGLIADLFAHYPEARYRLTQTAFVQEAAIAEAQNRIKRLEVELVQTRQALGAAQQQLQQAQQAQQAQQSPAAAPQRSGFFSGLFGQQEAPRQMMPAPPAPPTAPNPWNQGAPAYAPPPAPPPNYAQQPAYAPPPAYPPGAYAQQPGMLQRGGSGFLGSALTTAAGVAGGVVVGNALMDMFSGHHGGIGGGYGGGMGGFGGPVGAVPQVNETIINNNYGGADPNYPPPGAPDPNYQPWGGGADTAGWDQSPPGQTVSDYENSAPPDDGYWSKDAVYNDDNATPPDDTDLA